MTGLVSLPMYDLPGLRPFWDDWWRLMCRAMASEGVGGLDDVLSRFPDLMSHWRNPAMRLSQTCGYPYKLGLEQDWRVVATPVYAVDWCEGPNYRNLILVRKEDEAQSLTDLQGRRVAYNSRDSHSGYNSIRWMIAPLAAEGRFFGASIRSGSHLASIKALTAGEVDTCSVDCVTYALITKHKVAQTGNLRVLAEGPAVPGLPLVVPRSMPEASVEAFREALILAVARPEIAALNRSLLVDGFENVPEAAYEAIALMALEAQEQNYPVLN